MNKKLTSLCSSCAKIYEHVHSFNNQTSLYSFSLAYAIQNVAKFIQLTADLFTE